MPGHMDEKLKRISELVMPVLGDHRIVEVNLSVRDCYLMVSWLQLVTRHPGISAVMKEICEGVARDFQKQVSDIHPGVNEVLEMGWDWNNDVLPDDAGGLAF